MKDLNTTRPAFGGVGEETFMLAAGALSLSVSRSDELPLFKIAERQNPKRAFLFVSTVLGRHIPVVPSAHRYVLDRLSEKVQAEVLEGPVFVMGYAETAVGIGAGVFDSLAKRLDGRQIGYLTTTRHPISAVETWFTIEEGHSHATHHHILKPADDVLVNAPQTTLVLVDDETTTGSTFHELAQGLKDHGARFEKVILVTLTDWSNGSAIQKIKQGLQMENVVAVSLLEGAWRWTQDPEANLPALPGFHTPLNKAWSPTGQERLGTPRMGVTPSDTSATLDRLRDLDLPVFSKDDRILIIGTGENVWVPFLYAELLEKSVPHVKMVATTRSPILPGPVIEHKIVFEDHFGIGIDMYLHNVDPGQWDQIILFTETESDNIAEDVRSKLGKGFIVNHAGSVEPMLSSKGQF